VDVGVRSVQIAQRLLEATTTGLEDEPGVTGRVELLPSNGEAKLARHVETRSRRRLPVNFDSGQIVNRITATLDQGKDSIQTALATGNP
jgi:hypothetical protein